ncbi:CBS domain-containing protein [Acanthopleuribacter pedis]|uniref:CBS domain-containing protein n=1 Tax=Acanthopleuribacter pedis TaxID=442870 RepID=A0A8J7U4K1_9BACT|nr:CBS domain-containing protein [Acanthopleuribacter pedis]MBO1319874.1 CBS domain-containing protein [Acanthopleuribacter pedis]
MTSPRATRSFTRRLLDDLNLLQSMFEQRRLEENRYRIGYEQEVSLVHHDFRIAPLAELLLRRLDNPQFVHEFGLFNLELNGEPVELKSDALTTICEDLQNHLNLLDQTAATVGCMPILTGILPTIQKRDLQMHNMTPLPRYQEIDQNLRRLRGGRDFQVTLTGEDELNIRHGCSLLEAATTSFQLHYQINPSDFADQYNFAQLIAAPLLAVSANSPLLFGARLWHETRIGLFRSSIDTRHQVGPLRERPPRVKFGNDWAGDSPLDLFWEDLIDHRFIVTTTDDYSEKASPDHPPTLPAFQLLTGTVYRWNRVCYGVTDKKPHLRIENRILPAGPTLADQTANAAFWWGMMAGLTDRYRDLPHRMRFDKARANFYNAAKTGITTPIKWLDGKIYPAHELVLDELLPMAHNGLERHGIDKTVRHTLLEPLVKRCERITNGATWMRRSFANFLEKSNSVEARHRLTCAMHERRMSGEPVSDWSEAGKSPLIHLKIDQKTVDQVMDNNPITLDPEDLADLAYHYRARRKTRFIPVETDQAHLVGMVDTLLLPSRAAGRANDAAHFTVRSIMGVEVETVRPQTPIAEALKKMALHGSHALPVVMNDQLVGLFSVDCLPNITEPALLPLVEMVKTTLTGNKTTEEKTDLIKPKRQKPFPSPVARVPRKRTPSGIAYAIG